MTDSSSNAGAWGVGLATVTDGGQVLDTWYPSPALVAGGAADVDRAVAEAVGAALGDGGAPGTARLAPAVASAHLITNGAGKKRPSSCYFDFSRCVARFGGAEIGSSPG